MFCVFKPLFNECIQTEIQFFWFPNGVLYTLTKMEFVGSVIEDWVIPSFVEFMVRRSVFKPHKQSRATCDSGMG